MKIKNITDPKKFFQQLETCTGKVELVTPEGDRLNLKSKLSQYVMLSNFFDDAKIQEIELLFSEPEDLQKLLAYLIRG